MIHIVHSDSAGLCIPTSGGSKISSGRGLTKLISKYRERIYEAPFGEPFHFAVWSSFLDRGRISQGRSNTRSVILS